MSGLIHARVAPAPDTHWPPFLHPTRSLLQQLHWKPALFVPPPTQHPQPQKHGEYRVSTCADPAFGHPPANVRTYARPAAEDSNIHFSQAAGASHRIFSPSLPVNTPNTLKTASGRHCHAFDHVIPFRLEPAAERSPQPSRGSLRVRRGARPRRACEALVHSVRIIWRVANACSAVTVRGSSTRLPLLLLPSPLTPPTVSGCGHVTEPLGPFNAFGGYRRSLWSVASCRTPVSAHSMRTLQLKTLYVLSVPS